MVTTPTPRARSTDRVTINIQIAILGKDMDGRAFREEGRALEVNRNGALILVNRNLAPQEEILIRRERTGKEARAQVVVQVRKRTDGFVYGVKLLDPSLNLWDINFVSLTASEQAVGRMLLECSKCRLREVVYLGEYENQALSSQPLHLSHLRALRRVERSGMRRHPNPRREHRWIPRPRPIRSRPPPPVRAAGRSAGTFASVAISAPVFATIRNPMTQRSWRSMTSHLAELASLPVDLSLRELELISLYPIRRARRTFSFPWKSFASSRFPTRTFMNAAPPT